MRIRYKQEKNPLQMPYKIVLNATYGISKAKNSKAYDPRRANEVCINGQLLLLDLIYHCERDIPSLELIQSNTDGLIVKIDESDFDKLDDVCYEWENRTGMRLGFDYIDFIYQKDVNNYLFTFENGEIERKGAYVKENNSLDNDLPIINTALVNYLITGKPVAKTIYGCTDPVQFQKVFKLTTKYHHAEHNGQTYTNKVYRVFASLDKRDGYLKKIKHTNKGERIEKFANCPEHCFIENGKVDDSIFEKLDYIWYINLARKRLNDYGCN